MRSLIATAFIIGEIVAIVNLTAGSSEAAKLSSEQFEAFRTNILQPVLDGLQKKSLHDAVLQYYLSQLTLRPGAWDGMTGYGNAHVAPDYRNRTAAIVVDVKLLSTIHTFSRLDVVEDGYKEKAREWWRELDQNTKDAIFLRVDVPAPVILLEEFVDDPLDRESLKLFAEQEEDQTIAWVVLHEIAHHVLSHRFTNDLEQSRQKELEADNWAFRKLEYLNYPLLGVYKFLTMMARYDARVQGLRDGQSEPASSLRMKQMENQSTHPAWETRANALASNFDVYAQPRAPYKCFTTVSKVTRKDGGKELLTIYVVFPQEKQASTWGRGLMESSTFGGYLYPIWVEYRDGQAELYCGEGRLELVFKTPEKLLSMVDFISHGPSGEIKKLPLFGWYDDSLTKFQGDDIIKNMSVFEGLELSNPVNFLNHIVNQMDWPQELKQRAMASITGSIGKFNNDLLQTHKGMFVPTEEQTQSMWLKFSTESKESLQSVVGEERLKVFQAKVFANQIFQSAMADMMKKYTVKQQ